MHALVLQDSAHDAAIVARVLETGGWVADVYTGHDPWARLVSNPPELLVVDWGPNGANLDLVKRLREHSHATEYTYVLMLTGHGAPREIAAAYAAGVDDFARRPCSNEELLGRAGGARRFSEHVKRALASAIRAEAEMAKLIERLPAWRCVDEVVCKELVAMLNLELSASPFERIPDDARGATIRLALPSEALDVRMTLFVPEPSLHTLGHMLLGEGELSGPQIDDLLFEMVNNAAGAFRRELNTENIALTGGLPRSISVEDGRAPRKTIVAKNGVLRTEGVEVVYLLSAVAATNDRVPAGQLREGMVVVRSVFNHAGAMLVPAGTRISSAMASRVAEALGPDGHVEVSMEAA